jgi:hypothetical protein
VDLMEQIAGHRRIGLGDTAIVLPDNRCDPELTQALHDAQEQYFARKSRR